MAVRALILFCTPLHTAKICNCRSAVVASAGSRLEPIVYLVQVVAVLALNPFLALHFLLPESTSAMLQVYILQIAI